MKNIRSEIRPIERTKNVIPLQMELTLPGSRLTRDEASFLQEIRRMREQLRAGK